jgi:hypothetical protein
MPLGLSIVEPHRDLEMREFADKVLLSLIGLKADYLTTPGGDRSHHMLGLKSGRPRDTMRQGHPFD